MPRLSGSARIDSTRRKTTSTFRNQRQPGNAALGTGLPPSVCATPQQPPDAPVCLSRATGSAPEGGKGLRRQSPRVRALVDVGNSHEQALRPGHHCRGQNSRRATARAGVGVGAGAGVVVVAEKPPPLRELDGHLGSCCCSSSFSSSSSCCFFSAPLAGADVRAAASTRWI